jgi:alkanesulfonate monooxygenase SsuD/methylene tetrahydromethanopterin reductase-like flavin-dependent oxidoreductase (luciferase family)
VTFQGRYVHLQDCISNPKPLQKPHPIDGDFDGFVLTFPDFIGDLQFFCQRVLPLMADAGFARPVHQMV